MTVTSRLLLATDPARRRAPGLRVALALQRGLQRGCEAAVRRSRARGERGDVPGWVLVTLMTAGLVSALYLVAKDRLTEIFEQAVSSVTGTAK